MEQSKDTMQRINSRVRKDQFKSIRTEAKKKKVGEGEMHRIIIDYYFSNHK